MAQSLSRLQKEFNEFKAQVQAGLFTQRSALGPGAISKTLIKSKSIQGHMLDVSELAAITSNTGQLNVTDLLRAGSGVNSLNFDPTNGLYLGNETFGSAPFRVTPGGAATMTGASVSGGITATTLNATATGQISSWAFDSDRLSNGNTGLGTSGSFRIWSGNLSSPSLANFSVDNSGNIKSAGGSIAGMAVSANDMRVGNAGVGSSSGFNLWAGNSSPGSAPFRVNTSGGMTATSAAVTGSVTATSGSFTGSITTSSIDANGGTLASLTIDGQLTLGAGGSIVDSDGSSWTQSGIELVSAGSFGDNIVWRVSGVIKGAIFADSNSITMQHGTSTGNGYCILSAAGAALGVFNDVGSFEVSRSGSNTTVTAQGTEIRLISENDTRVILGDGAGVDAFRVENSSLATVFGVASNGGILTNQTATNTNTPSGATALQLPIRNTSGTIIGYIPVYGSPW